MQNDTKTEKTKKKHLDYVILPLCILSINLSLY